MLNSTWKDSYVAQAQRTVQLARAKQERELRSIQLSRGEANRLARWMIVFGNQMQVWGCRLQSRYETVLQKQQASAIGVQLSLSGESSLQQQC